MMTETVQLALVASIAPTIAAVAALAVSIANHFKASETAVKTDTIIEKTAEIHMLADGNLSKVTASLGIANEKILGMEKLLAQLAQTKTDTATAQAALLEAAIAAPPPPPHGRRAGDV